MFFSGFSITLSSFFFANLIFYSSYTYIDSTEKTPVIKKTQTSVVRSNCMDCLDRTNVVQSTLARWVLTEQLRQVGILESNQKVEDQESFMTSYRNSKTLNICSIYFTSIDFFFFFFLDSLG